MKKFLAISIVLAMASIAAAGTMTFEVVGDTGAGLVEGSIVTINVIADTKIGGFSGGINGIGTAQAPLVNGFASFAQPMQNVGTIANNGTALITGISVNAPFDFMSGVDAGSALYTFDYVVPSVDNMTFTLSLVLEVANAIDFMPVGVASYSSDILAVPEPMSVLLLGLGGLFLRRRK